jgi:tetratricopeptide (TPR) repeat protein
MYEAQLGRLEDSLRTFAQLRERMQNVLEDEPANHDARCWLSSAWHNMGDVLVHKGRPAEAVTAFQRAIEEKQRVLAEGPRTRELLRSLGNHYLEQAEAKCALGQRAEAASRLWEQRQLWDNDSEGLFKLAHGMALCIGPADDQKYAEQAMEALWQAVALGFRDVSKIVNDTNLSPLRRPADFQALVADLAFPADPFAPGR